jgi:hypothetical protein
MRWADPGETLQRVRERYPVPLHVVIPQADHAHHWA